MRLRGGEIAEISKSFHFAFVMLMNLGSVLTSPEHLQAVFKDSNRHFKAVNSNSGYLMSQVLGQCVGLISGTEWRDVHNITEVPFLHSKTTNYIPLAIRRTEQCFLNLHAHSQLNEGLINPTGDLKLLPFWIVAEILYGDLSSEQEKELRELIPLREELFKHVIKGGVVRMWWSKYLPIEANRSLDRFKARWVAFNNAAYRRAIELGNDTPIIDMFKTTEDGTIGKEQLYQTLDEMLYGNLDVTTGGISWCLVFLAAHQRVQDKLRDEIDLSIKQDGDLEQYFLRSSTFLAACISESARLKPIAAFSIPQSAPTDRVVGGFNVPAGTNFIVDSYALNIRNDFWGPDRVSYRPERFLESPATNMRYNFWRFGFGPRQCMGKYVVDLIIRVLLAHLVTNYKLDLSNAGEEWQRNPEAWITHPNMQIRCTRRNGEKGPLTN